MFTAVWAIIGLSCGKVCAGEVISIIIGIGIETSGEAFAPVLLPLKAKIRQFPADIDRSADVFTSVNSVACWANDFGHIRPHRIETLARKTARDNPRRKPESSPSPPGARSF